MEKLQKCVNFILTVPVFFATSCNILFFPTSRAFGLSCIGIINLLFHTNQHRSKICKSRFHAHSKQ
jgi:hypothetical protein